MTGKTTTTTTTTPPLRAVLYVRISDDPEGAEKGVDRQEADCRAYAEAQGFSVVEVFRENDTSAFKQRTITLPTGEKVRRVVRPRFRAMLQLLARHGAEAMIAYDLDRAVRDPRDLEDLIDAKVLYGFRVLSTTGSLRLDSDSDIAMARVLVAMANKSSADTARRVARASKQQALEGRWHGGRAPYGYRMGDSTLYVVSEHAALVREAADRVLAGESLYVITRTWNERGERTRNGVVWSEKALAMILRNPALKGIRIYRPTLPDGSYAVEPEVTAEGNPDPRPSHLGAGGRSAERAPGAADDVAGRCEAVAPVLRADPLLGVWDGDAQAGTAVHLHQLPARHLLPRHQRRRGHDPDRGRGVERVRPHRPHPGPDALPRRGGRERAEARRAGRVPGYRPGRAGPPR
nr:MULTISPECIES: recombinase family protein [unclassified Nonomuraea]